ncbi:MAG TPA: hypothetical protein VL527_04395 [Dongiaceae bacterium]|jgi:hypothetical protein|nr:hypothetical protein [Dongiaceae bacterium]
MPDPAPNSQLIPSLGRLVRGLSSLFWGLPLTLLVCVQTARTDLFHTFNLFPPVLFIAWLLYGLWQLGYFQRQERIWLRALDRTRMLGLISLGLAPFLYWWNQVPYNAFFSQMVMLLTVMAVLFLSELNLVLRRLGAMLPDETLRLETRQFTTLNRTLLLLLLLLMAGYFVLNQFSILPLWVQLSLNTISRQGLWVLVFLVLLPLAMTMALLWKIKEVILASIFGTKI